LLLVFITIIQAREIIHDHFLGKSLQNSGLFGKNKARLTSYIVSIFGVRKRKSLHPPPQMGGVGIYNKNPQCFCLLLQLKRQSGANFIKLFWHNLAVFGVLP
jgi:hypothetical protein